jgi:peptidylprolyl isomerase
MAKLHQRLFAASGAILFFITASALTVAVVVQAVQDRHSKNNSTASTQTQATACDDTQTESTLPAPEVYKTSAPVTALQSTDLEAGTGQAAKAGDCLVVKYYGTLASSGTVFDETYTKPTAFAFTLGQGQVIPGWDQGMVGLKVGGTRRLVIPANLAYGSQSPSEQIPANSDLVFVVKLLRIQK